MAGRCVVRSAVLKGVAAIPVEVEVVVSHGVVAFNVVGMADAAVQESRERVRAALKQSGFSMPADRVLVNLAPSSLKKTGSGFDLAIAVGLLVATGQVNPEIARNRLFVGELSLDGRVRPVTGLLAYGLCARDQGCQLVCSSHAEGIIPMEGLEVQGLGALSDLRERGFSPVECRGGDAPPAPLDFADISGNEVAKRALQVAAAGSHGVLMMGPPGSGKSMLASRLPSILPPLTSDELLQCALIHSVAGEDTAPVLAGRRPFRSPHHSATSPSLIGGGSPVKPGEISLAHHGVLFLDELAEFKPSVLQQVRQPLEEGTVRIARAEGTVAFPARFMLVGAANPCPCGFYGDRRHECSCGPARIQAYQNRIGGPLMDRIDIHIDVSRVDPREVIASRKGTASAALREGVLKAREYASWRRARQGPGEPRRDPVAACRLDDAGQEALEAAARTHAMSGRGIVRTLAIARTIADMEEEPSVSTDHLYEALGLRVRGGGA